MKVPDELRGRIDGLDNLLEDDADSETLTELLDLADELGEKLERANARVGTYVDEIEELVNAIERSGYDVSPCSECGCPTVCIPDGMPLCEPCGTKGQ